MEVTHSCVNLLLLLQKIFHPPCQLFLVNGEVHARCRYFHPGPCLNPKNRKAKNIWNLNALFFKVAAIFLAFRCRYLIRHWNEGNNIEQLCCYAGAFAISIVTLFTFHCFQHGVQEFCYIFPQLLKLSKFLWKGYPSSILQIIRGKGFWTITR